MKIEVNTGGLNITVKVDEDGYIELPLMKFTPAQLKKIAVAVNREMRSSRMKEDWQ